MTFRTFRGNKTLIQRFLVGRSTRTLLAAPSRLDLLLVLQQLQDGARGVLSTAFSLEEGQHWLAAVPSREGRGCTCEKNVV